MADSNSLSGSAVPVIRLSFSFEEFVFCSHIYDDTTDGRRRRTRTDRPSTARKLPCGDTFSCPAQQQQGGRFARSLGLAPRAVPPINASPRRVHWGIGSSLAGRCLLRIAPRRAPLIPLLIFRLVLLSVLSVAEAFRSLPSSSRQIRSIQARTGRKVGGLRGWAEVEP